VDSWVIRCTSSGVSARRVGEANPLAFYDFPAEHWIHLRTTKPIESTLQP